MRRNAYHLSLFVFNLSAAVLAGIDLVRLFWGSQAVVTVFSLKWLVPITGITFLSIALIATSWLAYTQAKSLTRFEIWLERQRRKPGPVIWGFAFAVLALLSWVYLFSPLQTFLTITTRDSWMHLLIFIWAVQVIGVSLSQEIRILSSWHEGLIALFLFFLLQIVGPFFIFYPLELGLAIFCAILLVLALYRREALTEGFSRFVGFVQKFADRPFVIETLTGIAFLLYLWQAWTFAHTNISILDEGSYLYKGFLFASGRYVPYQDYGPWTNKMPLSFLIPGYVQLIFGPGLRTARYFQVFLQGSMVAGVWLIARRLGERWGALAAVVLLAVNPVPIFIYSQAVTQGLVVCLLVWSLVFALGKNRPTWQLAVGSLLAAITFLTRENLAPYLVLIILYIFWQYGWKKGMVASLTALLTLASIHVLYWPGILRIWAYWLPKTLTPFLDPWRYTGGGTFPWDMAVNLSFGSSFNSFWDGVGGHFGAFLGGLGLTFLLPGRKHWQDPADFRTAIFLAVAFNLLMLAHAWASLANAYCVYCFVSYLAFFAPLGLFLLVLVYPHISEHNALWKKLALAMFSVLLMAGTGFGLRKNLSGLLNLKVLSIGAGGQSVSLWSAVSAPLRIDYYTVQRLIPALFMAGLGLLLLIGVWAVKRLFLSRAWAQMNFWRIFLPLLLIVALTVTAIPIYHAYGQLCKMDEIAAYEQAGKFLAKIIPPGAQVYWSSESAVPLLYTQVEIYPPQLNDGFAFRRGSRTDLAYRFGYWNDELAQQWQQEADYVLMDDNGAQDPANTFLAKYYVEIGRTNILQACNPSAFIHVYKHK